MRKWISPIVIFAACAIASAAGAQSVWPARPVSIIVPLAAGGTADGVARILAEQLSEIWGQRVIVENRAGGNLIAGTDAVAKAAPDGHTLGMGLIGSHVSAPLLFNKLPYDAVKDFTPIALLATSPVFLIVHPSVPASTVPEFIAYAKANPDKLSYASSGYGSSYHLATEQVMMQTGIKMVHVPYKGMATAILDLLAGTVQVAFDTTTLAQVRDGKLKALGVVAAQRFAGAPEIPTFVEQGLTGLEVTSFLTLHAPARLPTDLQTKINVDVNRALAMPDVRRRMLLLTYAAAGGTPADLDAFLAREREKVAVVIKANNIKVEQ